MATISILRYIENTYSDSRQINIVGLESDMKKFIKECKQNNVWFYRVCTLFVYKRKRFQIVFLKKQDQQIVKTLIKDKELVLNASNPFLLGGII